jgi:hypothetical protein
MSSTPVTPKESWLQKAWDWVVKQVKIVETDVEDLIGPQAAQQLEAIGKNLLSGPAGAWVTQALADATNVVTGQMSVSAAITSLIALAKADGKQISEAGALQLIGLAQNALPAKPATVTPVA